MKPSLKDFAQSTYSQYGEDGIITEILSRISTIKSLDKWCVEFGAWDGVHLSNTCKFLREDGYKGVLIEGNKKRVIEMRKNLPSPDVIKMNRTVSFEGKNSLESILKQTPIPKDFDFISIDVDGVDYFIFESLTHYRPKVVCIEFNPTIPNSVEYIQPKSFAVKHGSSAKSLNHLAELKGYALVEVVRCNMFFVDKKYLNAINVKQQNLAELNSSGNNPTYIFAGYDGTVLSNKGGFSLPWHQMPVPIEGIQVLPRYLRQFYGDYGIVKRQIFNIFKFSYYAKILIFNPSRGLNLLKKALKEKSL